MVIRLFFLSFASGKTGVAKIRQASLVFAKDTEASRGSRGRRLARTGEAPNAESTKLALYLLRLDVEKLLAGHITYSILAVLHENDETPPTLSSQTADSQQTT